MTNRARRQDLMICLADAEYKKVNVIDSVKAEEMKEGTFELSVAHFLILEQRRDDYINGKSKPEPWQEVHDRIGNYTNPYR